MTGSEEKNMISKTYYQFKFQKDWDNFYCHCKGKYFLPSWTVLDTTFFFSFSKFEGKNNILLLSFKLVWLLITLNIFQMPIGHLYFFFCEWTYSSVPFYLLHFFLYLFVHFIY